MKASIAIILALTAQGVAQATDIEPVEQKRCPYVDHVEKHTAPTTDRGMPNFALGGDGLHSPMDRLHPGLTNAVNVIRKEWI